ncbi:hypothetical protein MYP_1222 [Sporocytophaga myxococcoides]|uniref:Lipocalin-like domain-containing protein n=2 Tax=Sporocytophaga myxococcoides TaxID=153721 RepID=A0A098LC35_9BACT|nr:hypothetical protein MYP_1222 [Sporocytophaga myxococcoides]
MVVFSSCKKDKDEAAAPSKSKTEYLTTAKGWKITGFTIAGQSMFNQYVDACEKSALDVYKTGGSYDHTYADKCDEDYDGTWKLTNNDSQIEIDGDTYKIDELNGSTFKYSETQSSGGASVTTQYIFTAQK